MSDDQLERNADHMARDITIIIDFLNHLQDARRTTPAFRRAWQSSEMQTLRADYSGAAVAADRLQSEITARRQQISDQ